MESTPSSSLARRSPAVRLLSLATGLALVAAILAGCGSDDGTTTSDDTKVSTSADDTSADQEGTSTSATEAADDDQSSSAATDDEAADDEAAETDGSADPGEELALVEEACTTFGDEVGAAVTEGQDTTDEAAQAAALTRFDSAVRVLATDLGGVTLAGNDQTTLDEILASLDDLSTEIDNATGDAVLIGEFFDERPTGVSVAVEQITARSDELGIAGCQIDWATPAS